MGWGADAAFVPAQTTAAVPAGWANQDIGAPGLAGSATETSGVVTITAGGSDIWDTADEFHFVYQPLTGDGEITARVLTLGATDVWAKAGVMMRETLTGGSTHAFALVSAERGTAFQRRTATGGTSDHAGGPGAAAWWVRLTRRGNVFEALESQDGVTWRSIGSQTIPMLETIYVGLAVTSHNASTPTLATISDVTLSQPQPGNQPPTVSLTSPIEGATFTAPGPVNVTASASDPDGSIASVAFYADAALIGTDSTAPYAAAWSNIAAGSHRLTAVATDSGGTAVTSTAVNVVVQGPSPASGDIVIHAEDIAIFNGAWAKRSDSTAADGLELATANLDRMIDTPLAAPVDYFEVSFDAQANTPYRVWLRLRGADDSKYNESVWVQFSDSLDATGAASYRIDSTDALMVNLEDCYGCGIHGWGWQTRAWWRSDPGIVRFATTGTHTMRVQLREDGVMLDQIVLSPGTYLNASPGTLKDDTTIVPRSGGANQPPATSITAPADGATFAAAASITVAASASDSDGTISRVDFYAGSTRIGTDSSAPYSMTWSNVAAGSYSLTAVATDDTGASGKSGAVSITVGGTNQPPAVALTSPGAGFSFGAPATLSVAATATDPDGSIARVEFYAGTTLLGTDTSAPYSLAWNVLSPAGYSITAVAVDNVGARTTSAVVSVAATASQAAFTASPDHATLVTGYRLEIFVAGADPNTATPVAVLDLGKPAPVGGDIMVNITGTLQPLAAGNYVASVLAIGTGGSSRSAPVVFVR